MPAVLAHFAPRADHHFPDAEELIRRRIDIEERYVYPLFERMTGAGDFRRAHEAFVRLESQHRICEDRLLFPLVDHVLEENALADLVTLLANRSTR